MSRTNASPADLFTFSRSTPDPHFAFTLSIEQLCTCIENSRLETLARVISLTRFKQLSGFRHKFIMLKICMVPDNGEFIWIRLERGPKLGGSAPKSLISQFVTHDSAMVSPSEVPLLHGVRFEKTAEVIFPIDRPTAGDLRRLLTILSETSPKYYFHSQNCKWFCSVIQESLTSFYSGELRFGTLSRRYLGEDAGKRIVDRLLRTTT